MSWREDLVGKDVLVLGPQVIGTVTHVFETGTFLRDNADPDEKPIDAPVIQIDNSHAFLADDEQRSHFQVLNAADVFVVESMRESLKNGIAAGFRVAVAARQEPAHALTLLLAALTEAQRSLQETGE